MLQWFREDTGWTISGDDLPYPDPKFKTEADMRIWWHATDTSLSHVLIYSPDTDVHNVGLALTKSTSEFIVQINMPHSKELKYVHLSNLVQALHSDPDLATLSRSKLPRVFQMLFVCTGCDYTSFFCRAWKGLVPQCILPVCSFYLW